MDHKTLAHSSTPLEEDDEINLAELFGVIYANRLKIVLATLIFTLSGLFYAITATPIYRVDSKIQVETKQGGLPSMDDLTSLLTASTAEAATEMEILRSRRMFSSVIDQLQLAIVAQPRYLPLAGRAIHRLRHDKNGGLAPPP